MLTCHQIATLVTDYLEGRMPFIERVWFRLHTGGCEPCRKYLRQMELSVAVLGEMPAELVPGDVMDSLLARFDAWNR